MKLFIQNTSLNRVLLALAVSVATGGIASATPAGTVASTITKPEHYLNYPATSVPFSGRTTVSVNGTSGMATYSFYFFGSDYKTYALGGETKAVYSVQSPTTFSVGDDGVSFTSVPVGTYSSHFDSTLSASGKTSVTNNATDYFGTY